jgi:hypothetical protein
VLINIFVDWADQLPNYPNAGIELHPCFSIAAKSPYHSSRSDYSSSVGLAEVMFVVPAKSGYRQLQQQPGPSNLPKSPFYMNSLQGRHQRAILGLDSREKVFRQLLIMYGMVDEQFIIGLSDKVRRGMEGVLLRGYNPGGRCYGYSNIPEEDHTRKGEYGRQAVNGVRLIVNKEEALVVIRIFEMVAQGMSLARISKLLNAECIASPNGANGNHSWSPSCIHSMIRNQRYRGIVVWGRTKKARHPVSGKKIQRKALESTWKRIEAENLRIVSEELW